MENLGRHNDKKCLPKPIASETIVALAPLPQEGPLLLLDWTSDLPKLSIFWWG